MNERGTQLRIGAPDLALVEERERLVASAFGHEFRGCDETIRWFATDGVDTR